MKKSISYSDGNVELEIEYLLKNASDLNSLVNIAEEMYDNWPIRYHLSSIRGNAIRHLDFTGLDVLELGAGMGAMSRVIAEQAKHLTCVEGTQQRMNCLKERLRDLHNWDGEVCNYQDFKTDRKYDVVCFFGVLEYAGRYIDQPDPYQWALQCAKSFLKEDGVLLITIENKLGLKYFAGAAEDHYGKPFYGICGYSEVNDIKTFSKKEMFEMLKNCGFNNVDTWHYAPDYKMTQAVLSDNFVKEHPFVAADILSGYPYIDYNRSKKELFSEKLALHSIAKSGLLEHFTNSQLYIATKNTASDSYKNILKKCKTVEGFLYSNGRKNETITSIIKKDKKAFVHKQFLHSVKLDNKSFVYNCFKDEPLYEGTSLIYLLSSYKYYNNSQQFFDLLYHFIEETFNKFETNDHNYLRQEAFDAIARNTKIVNNQFVYFDSEYSINFKLSKSYFLFRLALHDIYQYIDSLSFIEFYNQLCQRFNVKPNLEEWIKNETEVQKCLVKKAGNYTDMKAHIYGLSGSKHSKNIKIFGIKVGNKVKQGNRRKIKLFGVKFSYQKRK